MDNKIIIKNAFLQNNVSISDKEVQKFCLFYDLLVEYNQKYNLTAITQINDVCAKHFVDSVFGANLLAPNSTVLDIGCGAGFPSIPLAIMRPDLSFCLIDSVGKKIDFINVVKNKLELNNIQAYHTRAQEFCNKNNRGSFDFVVSRALAPLNILLELCIPFLKQNGTMLAYKGVNFQEEIDNAKNAVSKLYVDINDTKSFKLTLDNNEALNRFILIIKKTKPTPTIYPRLKNSIKTNPL